MRPRLSIATKWILCLCIVTLIVWATVAAVFGAEGSTISEHVRDYASTYPIVPFLLGVLCGHWGWAMRPAQRPHGLVLLALLPFGGCAAPFRWQPPTPDAVAERRIASQLRSCYRGSSGWPDYVAACDTAAASRCALAGLPDDCGKARLWFECQNARIGTPVCHAPADTRTQL